MNKVLVLGGYGNFGKRISQSLVEKGIEVIIAGRSIEKAKQVSDSLGSLADFVAFDINGELNDAIKRIKPIVVIHTCGPFQGADYRVGEICIENATNYIDLSDGRGFVSGISRLDEKARLAGVRVISGASTVPGLSSAVVEHFQDEFLSIDLMRFGISPGQKAERGLATTQGILSYVGKRLAPFRGPYQPAYGWQDIYRQDYPGLGKRWMANCEIPDLDLLPEKYGIKQIQFSAGLEFSLLHLGLWGLSWLVRIGMPINLKSMAGFLLSASNWFNVFGSADGGMHVIVEGKNKKEQDHRIEWYIVAMEGAGPYIPTVPAVILAEQMVRGDNLPSGAYPCVGLIGLDEYLAELSAFPIKTYKK